jgi:hypothetical protein
LYHQLVKHTAYKFNLELFAEYVKTSETEDDEFSIKSFQTKMNVILNESEIQTAFQLMKTQILKKNG